MKNFSAFCFAFIMMIACSVGLANASPPKTVTIFFAPIVPFQNDVIVTNVIAVPDMAVIHGVTVIQMNEMYSDTKIHADAITSKETVLPSPKVIQLSRFIHYNVITNQSMKKIEPRARSSDLNQNKRC